MADGRAVPGERDVSAWLGPYPPEEFPVGGNLIESVRLRTAELAAPAARSGQTPPGGDEEAFAAYIVEGLVRGMWHDRPIAPTKTSTLLVSGDGRWIGADAFKYGKNLYQYVALAPTTASVIPFSWIRDAAPRVVLLDFLRSVSLDWCTSAAVLTLGADTLARKALLLLYDMSRLHPRPELEVRQKDVADMLGVARQSLQPILKQFESRGLITLGYAEIVISDPMALIHRLRHRR